MSNLSTSHRLILAAAAARADSAVLPLPDGLRVRGRARQLMLEGMVKRGLIAARPAQHGAPAWVQGDGDVALEITPEGRALVGSRDQEPPSRDDQPLEPATPRADANAPDPAPSNAKPRVRPGTKQALLIDLLRRPEGATIAEIQQATGWQRHTSRAAITGLKKKSLAVTSAPRRDGTRAYRLSPDQTDPSEHLG